jgi:hypothetical protein
MPTKQEIERNYTYHPPHGNQKQRYERIRENAKELAFIIVRDVPQSREQSLALTKLEEVVMWSNAGIARNEAGNDEVKDE